METEARRRRLCLEPFLSKSDRGDDTGTPRFVPVVMAAPASSSLPSSPASGTIEIVIVNTVVRVTGNVEAAALTSVLMAIKEVS